jgi:hypothetical protein
MELKESKSTMVNPLINKIIKVEPVYREGQWLPKGHDGEFMYTTAVRSYVLPKSLDTGQYIKILSEDEQRFFEDKLHLEKGTLSFYKKDNEFWESKQMSVRIDKNGIKLDLADPLDNLKWRILKANVREIAHSPAERFNMPTYKFMLVDTDYEVEEKATKSDKKKLAYTEFGKLQASETKMRNFLRVYGRKAAPNATREFLVATIDTILEQELNKFLEIVQDKSFEAKIFIDDAIEAKAIVRKGKTGYALPGGDLIGNTLEQTIEWINDPANSTEVLTIKARIDNNK